MSAVSQAGVPPVIPEDRRSLLAFVRNQAQAIGVLGVVVAVFVITGLHSSLFVQPDNIKVLAMNMSFVALCGVGTAILIITGNVDLSIGSNLGLTAVTTAMLSRSVPVPVAFAMGMALGGVIGSINGLLVWLVPTSPIIVTLGSMTLLQGVLYVVSGGQPVTHVPQAFINFANESPAGVPMPVWVFVLVTLLGYLFMSFTRGGRHCYAIGGNRDASLAAGVRVRRIVIGTFALNGIIVGLAGGLQASLYGSPDQTYGNGFELQVITAVIVGGVSFTGGEGGVLRAALGAALLATVGGSIVSFGVDANYAYVVNGGILIIAVSTDHLVHRQRERYQRSMAMRELSRLTEERSTETAPAEAAREAV